MSLRNKLAASILNMGIQRALDFASTLIVTTLVVRSLSRDEYGMLSVVLSYGLVFNMLNVSVSAILVRDYEKTKERIGEHMHAFLLFSAIKAAVVTVLGVAIGVVLDTKFHNDAMIAVLAVNVAATALTFLAEPFSTLLSVAFHQASLTRISLLSSAVNVALSAGAIIFPSAVYVSAKNAAVALVGLVLTAAAARKVFKFGRRPLLRDQLRLIKQSTLGFSLWSHLIGVVTDIVYRADLLVLGWLNAPFRTVGNYNIALQLSNFTKVLPQILQYNASLGLSRTEDARRREEITFLFVKYSFLLSAAIMIGYVVLGRFVIGILAGNGVEEIYGLGLYIIAGLCLFNTFRPLVSYAVVVHSVRECFLFAILPAGVGTLACYVAMGLRWGAPGLAWANLCGGVIMIGCTLSYLHERTDFRWRFSWITEAERQLLASVHARFRT